MEVAIKTHKIETLLGRRNIGGGTNIGVAFGRLSSFTNASTSLSTMRGEYSTPGI
jgi:hypothetical protein